ncbi:hypothetical protein E4U52_007992, partial [Claviceps spartinae]
DFPESVWSVFCHADVVSFSVGVVVWHNYLYPVTVTITVDVGVLVTVTMTVDRLGLITVVLVIVETE